VWDERADRARGDIAAMAASGLGVSDLHAAAISLISERVSAELTCWVTIDPETLVLSGVTNGEPQVAPEYEPRLAESEYSADEPHRFATLALRKTPLAKLSDMPERDRNRSLRFNNVWRPLGVDEELRVLFLADGTCWGAAGMVRTGQDFSARETEFLTAVAPAIATATRLAVRSEAIDQKAGGHPAIMVVNPQGETRAVTPAAREWQDRLEEIAPGRFTVMMQVMASGARTAASGGFRARLRVAHGQWAILHASPLIGGDDEQIAVAIEPATGDQLIGLLLTAYSLTARERDICHEVMAGHSTSDIAGRLFISSNTVQDHLKSVFGKVGVRSRGELVARLRPDGSSQPERVTQPLM
jgi:DNA-binding CsgD family transcriptional regulator